MEKENIKSVYPKIYLLFLCFICIQNIGYANTKWSKCISDADIVRYQANGGVNLYLGNGRMGSCFDEYGLHGVNDGFMHMQHFVRGKDYGADCLLKFMRIMWKEHPVEYDEYYQRQFLYDGFIFTKWRSKDSEVQIKSWFDLSNRDMACVDVLSRGKVSDIVVSIPDTANLYYGETVCLKKKIKVEQNCIVIQLSDGSFINTVVYFYTNGAYEILDGKIIIHPLSNDRTEIVTSVNTPIVKSAKASFNETKRQWHRLWKNTSSIIWPDEFLQKVWVRLCSQILFSTNGDKLGLPMPCGLSGYAWPFPFPQDVSFIYPLLLSTGHINIVKSWVEYLSERVEQMKSYTKRMFNVEGLYCPWGYSWGVLDRTFHSPKVPNKYYWGIHNSGYIARMAHEVAILNNDPMWTRKYVDPLIEGVAQFYYNICKKGVDGYWHIHVLPSLGQDEFGGENQTDYLCALFSAKYSFQRAIEYGFDTDGKYSKIMDKLAFQKLKNKFGFFASSADVIAGELGKQKHPVQLNDLAFLPVDSIIHEESKKAYLMRNEIIDGAKRCLFPGWTLGEFLLAASRIGNSQGWLDDFSKLYSCSDLTDQEDIQIYESYGNYAAPYYITSNGLILQSLLNNIVSDWFGKIILAGCQIWDGKIKFKNIYTLLGVRLSGTITNDWINVYVESLRDCDFVINGNRYVMKSGEKKKIKLNRKKE